MTVGSNIWDYEIDANRGATASPYRWTAMRDELDALLEQVRALDEREGSVAALSAAAHTVEDQAPGFAVLERSRRGSAHEAIGRLRACWPSWPAVARNHGMALLDGCHALG